MNFIKYFFSLLSLGVITTAQGKELMDMSLEELMDVKVSISTKTDKFLIKTPGSVTVFTERDLDALGIYTLKELVSMVPSFSSLSIHAGQSNFVVSGQRVEGFDNSKVLVLLDGMPVNNLRNYRAPMGENFSLIAVEKVEFLEGPSSAVYGTSAFNGVISITTKSGASNTGKLQVYGGSNNAEGARGFALFNTEQAKGKLRFSFYSKMPSQNIIGYEDGTRDKAEDKTRLNSGFDSEESYHAHAEVESKSGITKGLKLGYFVNRNANGTFETNEDYNGYVYLFSTSSFYLNKNLELSPSLKSSFRIRRNQSIVSGTRYNFSFYFKGYDVNLDMSYDLGEKSNFNFGLQYDTRELGDYSDGTRQGDGAGANAFVENGSKPLETQSMYIQYGHSLETFDELILTAGGRYDVVSSEYADSVDLSPRLSLVQMLGKSNSIKYEYATAIKSPDLKSTLINAGVIEEGSTLFQDKLKAESTESQDLIFFNRGKNHIAQIGIYNRTIKDAINRRSYDDKDSYRNDSGETISSGGKVSVKYFISREAIIDTSYSVTETKLPDVSDDEALNGQSPEGIPTSEMAVSYLVSNDQYRFSITGNYIDELTTSSKNLENHDGFMSVDTHFSYSLQDNMAVMFKARNIFGEDIRVPNFQENYNPRTTLIGFEGRF